METTLHQQLKLAYADGAANTEVTIGSFRIDAIRDDELIEIQCASLAAIRSKCQRLLQRHRVRVVKPVALRTRIAKVKRRNGKIVSRRLSPKRGSMLDLFDDLIYFTRVFPHENLTLEVPLIHIEQIRGPVKRRRRWHKDYKIIDVKLEAIAETREFRYPTDLLQLIDLPEEANQFNTADLAHATGLPRWQAQKIAYVLRKVGAIEATDRTRAGISYQRSEGVKQAA